VDARNNQATDAAWWREYTKKSGWQAERDLNFAKQMLFIPVKEDLIKDGWTDVWNYTRMLLDAKQKGKPEVAKYSDDDLLQLADMKKMELLRRRVDAIVKDPKTAAALKPWYNRMVSVALARCGLGSVLNSKALFSVKDRHFRTPIYLRSIGQTCVRAWWSPWHRMLSNLIPLFPLGHLGRYDGQRRRRDH
jgi:hypothetical protein